MTGELPPEIEVEEWPEGVRFRLARRPLGGARFFGLFPVLFGIAFASVAIGMMVGSAVFFVPEGGVAAWFAVGFILFMTVFVFAGVAMFALGLFILSGRLVIELKDGRLRAIERAGPFYWTRWRPADQIRKLSLHDGRMQINDQPVTKGPLAELGVLAAECEGAKPMLVAMAYPKDWLRPLADELARRCPAAVASAGAGSEPTSPHKPIEVTEEPAPDPLVFHERFEQPAGSTIVHEPHADGVTLTVPPSGLRKGSKGLFSFALIWLTFMTAMSALMLLVGFKDGEMPWIFAIILPVFWLAGLGMMLGAIHMGRRQAALAVVGDSLLVMQTGLFGGKKHEWPRQQISDVRTGPSGMSVNDVPVIELQVHLKSGTKHGLLAGRDESELQWIATVLRQALQVPAVSS